MKKLLLLIAALVLLPGVIIVQTPTGGGGGGTDFTSTIDFCYLMGTDGTEAQALDDKCTVGGSDDATVWFGSFTYGATAPAGSAVSTAAVSAAAGHAMQVADANFGNANDGVDESTFTVGAWVLADSMGFKSPWGKGSEHQATQPGGSDGYRLNTTASDVLTANGDTNSVWFHLVVTHDGTTTRGYINGVEDCGGSCPTNGTGHANTGDNFVFFSRSDGGNNWAGDMYEVFYYDGGVLSQSEICEIMLYGLANDADETTRESTFGDCT